MQTTCNSEFVLLARSAAVEEARLAFSGPSVAKRILVGKMLISYATPPKYRRLGNCPTNQLRQYGSDVRRSAPSPLPCSWYTFPGQVVVRSAPPKPTLSRPRAARGGSRFHLRGSGYATSWMRTSE